MADTHHNTTGLPGQSHSLHPGVKARPLEDIHHYAVFLHAFAQGVAEIDDTLKNDLSPPANSMPAMFDTLIDRASLLVNDIEIVDYVESRK